MSPAGVWTDSPHQDRRRAERDTGGSSCACRVDQAAAMPPGVLLVLGGPSASGKTTLLRLLRARRGVAPLLTSTTRAPRPGEADGADYEFLSPAAFSSSLEAGGMREHTEYAGVHYGVRARALDAAAATLAAGGAVAAALDARGLAFFRAWAAAPVAPGAPPRARLVSVFLAVPEEDVRRRLAARGSAAEEVARRLAHARAVERVPAYAAAYDVAVDNADGQLEAAYDAIVARMAA